MPLIGEHARVQLTRRVISMTPNLRKKGARRRTWWNPKMLGTRFYKGYGAGSFMSRTESGSYAINPERVRHYVAPTSTSSLLKPYVAADVPIVEEEPVTYQDYLDKMHETWTEEQRPAFEKMMAELKLYGRKAGKQSQWGF